MATADAQVRLDSGALRSAYQTAATAKLASVLRQIEAQAKNNTPVLTGNLRRSIEQGPIRMAGQWTVKGSVAAKADYALYVHEGSKSFVVRPRKAQALRFVAGGTVVYAKSAHIPARKPRPFLRNAVEQVAQRV